MPKTKISEFSATPASNTDIDSINIAEGCAPSGINDAIRELMAQLKDFQTGAVGDSFNGPVGTTTAAAGAFTTLSASSTVSGTGFSTYLASPPAIGGTAAAAVSATTLTTSSTVTLNGGTANGVAYLNGSKVVTSGSALTFDGSNVGVTASSSAGFVGITTQNTSAGAGASSGLGINNDSTASTYLRTYGSGQTNTLLGSVIANYTALLSDGAASNGILLGSLTNKPIIFGVNNAEVGRFTSTGLGIGTSSPAAKLDIVGSSSNQIRVGTATSEHYRIGRNASDGFLDFYGSQTGYQGYRFGGIDGTWATINSSGNLGLGVTPSAWASGEKAIQFAATGNIAFNGTAGRIVTNAYNDGSFKYVGTGQSAIYAQDGGRHIWYNAASGTAGNAITFTQAATLTANGDYLVGTTSTTNNSRFACNNTAGTRKWGFGTQGSGTPFYVVDDTSGSGVQLTAGATSWSSFSDERNKTKLKPFENAVEKVCTLRTGTGRYLTDKESVSRSFLIAQDVQKVLPEAVDSSEDEQGTLVLRYADLIPLLAAAIKELKEEFDAYKATHP